MIHLHPTTLIAVPVPEDAHRFYVEIDHDGTTYYIAYLIGENDSDNVILDGDYELIGTATKDTIDFDVEPYVCRLPNCNRYFDYTKDRKYFDHSDEAFRSLLTANDALFENPYGKTMPFVYDEDAGTNREHLATQWQTAQSKVNSKYVILEKL